MRCVDRVSGIQSERVNCRQTIDPGNLLTDRVPVTQQHVIIIGAGLAGLAAALKLIDSGRQVTVLEQRAMCGGRAYAFTDPKSGHVVDNGQHVLMGCYQAALRYVDRIGAREHLHECSTLRVDLQDAQQRVSSLHCPPIPTPLHVFAGLLRMRAFPKRDVWRLLRHANTLHSMTPELYALRDEWSVSDWLDHCGQSDAARRILWEPLTLAVMNETMERASAAPMLMIMREGLLSRGVAQGLVIPRANLTTTLIDPALTALEQSGAAVRSTSGVERILCADGRVTGVQLRNGESLHSDVVISAVPPQALAKIIAASLELQRAHWDTLEQWQGVPILSVNLWFDRPVLEQRMVGLYDTPFHWAFDRGDGGVALVASACGDIIKWSRQETLDAAITMMRTYFPKARAAQVKHTQLTKEMQATISMDVGSAARRLPTRTPWPNLLLAGDWTQTYIPATIEGAVRSGNVAAQELLR